MSHTGLTPKCLNRILGLSLFVFYFFILFQTEASAQGGRYDGWHSMMRGWGMGGFGMVFNIALWILAIAAVVWFFRWLFQPGGRFGKDAGSGSQALDILDQRYASGEIDKSQYDAMKRDIIAR